VGLLLVLGGREGGRQEGRDCLLPQRLEAYSSEPFPVSPPTVPRPNRRNQPFLLVVNLPFFLASPHPVLGGSFLLSSLQSVSLPCRVSVFLSPPSFPFVPFPDCPVLAFPSSALLISLACVCLPSSKCTHAWSNRRLKQESGGKQSYIMCSPGFSCRSFPWANLEGKPPPSPPKKKVEEEEERENR
jgi:hypothetical protein